MRRSSQRLIAILSLVAAVAALAVFAASGSNAQTGSTPEASTAPPTGSPAAALVSEGEKIYSTTCIACHQAGGKGVAGQVPALAGDALVNLADPHAMVQTVLNGRGGMPSFSSFSDEQVAAITSYVRQAFGNHASAVNPTLVTQVRAQFQVTLPVATPLGGPGTAGASVGAPGGTPTGSNGPVLLPTQTPRPEVSH